MLPTDKLSKREKDVTELLLQGLSNQRIALTLGITERTVEFHLNKIYTKLGVNSRVAAILLLGKSTGGLAIEKLKESAVAETGGQFYDIEKSAMKPKSRSTITMYSVILLIAVLVSSILVFQMEKGKAWIYEREAEFPDEFTVGQDIDRMNASSSKVHGQFGAATEAPWPAQSGFVKYYNINVPRSGELYLQVRYSKFSRPSVPVLIYIDDERNPRKSLYLSDQGDWESFAVTEWILLGKIERGIHSIKFSTKGQEFGIADLDKFILTTKPPQ